MTSVAKYKIRQFIGGSFIMIELNHTIKNTPKVSFWGIHITTAFYTIGGRQLGRWRAGSLSYAFLASSTVKPNALATPMA